MNQTELDQVIQAIVDTARQLWPQQTAEAQTWIDSELTRLGLSYARVRAQELYGQVGSLFQSPWIWVAVAYFILRR